MTRQSIASLRAALLATGAAVTLGSLALLVTAPSSPAATSVAAAATTPPVGSPTPTPTGTATTAPPLTCFGLVPTVVGTDKNDTLMKSCVIGSSCG